MSIRDTIDFKDKEFTEEIYLKAGEFAVVCFEGQRNARLEISAWEIDKEQFDILLVAPTDIMKDRYREDQSRLAEFNCVDFQDTYTFDRNQTLCLIISNMRAISREKIVKLRLSWVMHSDNDWPAKKKERKVAPVSKSTTKKPILSPKSIGYCTLLLIPIVVAIFVYLALGDAVIVSVATAITGIFVGVFKDEIRDAIGLSR